MLDGAEEGEGDGGKSELRLMMDFRRARSWLLPVVDAVDGVGPV